VIFQLVRYVMQKRNLGDKFGVPGGLGVLYFCDSTVEFPEILDLMRIYKEEYNIQYLEYSCSFKEGLQELIDRPPPSSPVRGVFLGLRRGDPGSNSVSTDNVHGSDHFEPSSAGWPDFMRIYPVLDWSYDHGKQPSINQLCCILCSLIVLYHVFVCA
jgi:3'-phosphoadenosine 5'-phosphosulfate sulfotransferase (PAPS reductase)/FAD synthetase